MLAPEAQGISPSSLRRRARLLSGMVRMPLNLHVPGHEVAARLWTAHPYDDWLSKRCRARWSTGVSQMLSDDLIPGQFLWWRQAQGNQQKGISPVPAT